MEAITYNLSGSAVSKSSFYSDLSVFANKILEEADIFLKKDIEAYIKFIEYHQIEVPRTKQEYFVEFITLGILYERYQAFAAGTFKPVFSILPQLDRLRKKYNLITPLIDKFKGLIITNCLFNKKSENIVYSLKRFSSLMNWLQADSCFAGDVMRLKIWERYFRGLKEEVAKSLLMKTVGLAAYFGEQGKLLLGCYTYNVHKFLTEEYPKHKNREDYIFCGRSETEYFLNMFGAEVISRRLKNDFDKTEYKVLFLPTCMSSPDSGTCKALKNGIEMSCTGCSHNCEVNKLQSEMKAKNVKTILINHSSDFSKALQKWKNNENTGIIGVGCVPNILWGGYEMINLNIKSQCVFLNYCGCKRHWHKEGIPTKINHDHLLKIINGQVSLSKGTNMKTAACMY